jgi:hypothetical protein
MVQFVQFDQHKRRGTDFAAASHAEGRWFDPSRDHTPFSQVNGANALVCLVEIP